VAVTVISYYRLLLYQAYNGKLVRTTVIILLSYFPVYMKKLL